MRSITIKKPRYCGALYHSNVPLSDCRSRLVTLQNAVSISVKSTVAERVFANP